MSQLQLLDVESTNLTGTLPEAWYGLTNLRQLQLENNQLSGSLPESWSSMTNLSEQRLSNNLLRRTLPQGYANLSQLQLLEAESNNLTGTLPQAWHILPSLRQLQLENNQLNGSLPESWSSMLNLSELHLTNNSLAGLLPVTWSNDIGHSLDSLKLLGNRLTGVVPASWGSIPYLEIGGNISFPRELHSPESNGQWNLLGLNVCPDELIIQSSDAMSYYIDTATCRRITIDAADWRACQAATLLTACASECESIYTGTRNGHNLCQIKNAILTVSLFWSALALLVLLSGCVYCVARYAMSRYSPDNNNCYTSSRLACARHSWDRALKWKLKLGAVKLGALIGLGVFWFDKATDVKLLLGLAVDGTPFRLLLALLVVPYVLQGYINLYWLTCTEPVKQWLSKSWLSELGNVILVPLLPVGILLTVALDVALFISDLGFSIPVIEQHANLEKYEPFRQMGRALFGTLPTVLLQSTVLTLPVKAASDIGITDTDTFLLALVAAALQLLKVCAETFYLALRDKNSVMRTFWQSLAGTSMVKNPMDSKTSQLVSLPRQQPSLSSQDEL